MVGLHAGLKFQWTPLYHVSKGHIVYTGLGYGSIRCTFIVQHIVSTCPGPLLLPNGFAKGIAQWIVHVC